MSVAFADSTFYIALLIGRDANHANAMAAARAWTGGIVTTEWVLTEVANHCGASRSRAKFGAFAASLRSDTNTTVVESSPDLWQRGLDFYTQYSGKEWSLTDCISFVVTRERGVTEALTADHHFDQAGFMVLMK